MSDVHVCRPKIKEYIGQVRRPGHRKWESIYRGRFRIDAARIVADMLSVSKMYKRGRVLAVDEVPYYEPILVFTMERK